MTNREAARKMYFAGERQADIARALGLSRQRVHQMVEDMDEPNRQEKINAWKEWLRTEGRDA